MADETVEKVDLGKCVICEGQIIIRDEEAGNDHCQNGHVYATDTATHEDFGPVPVQDHEGIVAEREREAARAEEARKAPEPEIVLSSSSSSPLPRAVQSEV